MNPSSPASKVKNQSKERPIEAPKLESLKQLNLDAAGLDVGAVVPFRKGQRKKPVFGNLTWQGI